MNNRRDAYKEVYIVLQDLNEEDYNRIPPEIIETIKENSNEEYEFVLNDELELKEQLLLPETKAILFNLFRDYLATPVQKEKILKMQSEERKKVEEKKKQKEISKEAERVVDSIITDDMTELEKEMAINQYLCDTAEYDMDALENAEENDFAGVDAKFNDSFTPYGVLLNKTGVCSSYAGAFKLLAQQAGLECIVVTGNLDGELPHAWNKIKIDGEWRIVDSTNNDNELILNALLNLPDYAADKVLVEDERFVLDDKVKDYEAKSDDKEFYRIEGKFYEKNKIFEPLKNELKEEGIAVLRTDYTLSDKEFMKIAQEVVEGYGSGELGGYYWLGVIYLTDEEGREK